MKRNRIFPILLIAALFLVSCQAEQPAATIEVKPAGATTILVEGRLSPRLYTDLAFAVAGRVAEVLAAEGDEVSAGQVLARLELVNGEARQADLARAEQELLAAQQAIEIVRDPAAAAQRQAQAQFDLANLAEQIHALQEQLDDEKERTEPDALLLERLEAQIELLQAQSETIQAGLDQLDGSGIDPDALQAAEARLAAAQAAVASAQAALQPVELKAPWGGTLARLNLVAGQSVTAGLPVATLADYSSWILTTDNLTEVDVVGVEFGEPVSFVLDALPDAEFSGMVESIRSKFEEKRGDITYTVTIALDGVDVQARWGMTAAIRLER